MLSSRLNNQLKPSLVLVMDENSLNSSLGFQFACAYACETVDKFSKVDILLTEHDETNWFQSHQILYYRIHVIDMFDDIHSTKTIEECLKITNEKNLIIIESLPWLLLRTSQGDLSRLLHNWSKSNIVIAVVPLDCIEENSFLKSLVSISYITIRIKNLPKSETIEARIEQRSRTNVDTIKSSDVTANLTFNLRLKDDELVAKNNLVLPYTKQQTQVSSDSCTIHYSYDKEDDIDEDEDDDLNLMTDETVTSSNIRSDLVDTAIGFLKNPKVAGESIDKKRDFLKKKGLTDNEIDYAFKIIPQQQEMPKEIVPHPQPSFLRRFLSDLILAGILGYALKIIKRWFQSKQSIKPNELDETIKSLQKTVQDMQASVIKLEQAANEFHSATNLSTSNGLPFSSPLEEIKREIQTLKGLYLSRSQFPSIPQVTPKIPSWQLDTAEKLKARTSPVTDETNSKRTNDDNKEDGDSIILVSENEKKSDDEHRLSLSPSSESSNDA
ncbi:unnamed protein product [Rotaria sp. Silwood1]|nr:unnamed protein product [Rotaria sp. Silwood1]